MTRCKKCGKFKKLGAKCCGVIEYKSIEEITLVEFVNGSCLTLDKLHEFVDSVIGEYGR